MVIRLKLLLTVIPKSPVLNTSDDNNLFILPVTQWYNTVCFASGHPEELMESDRRLPFAPQKVPCSDSPATSLVLTHFNLQLQTPCC